VKSLCYVRADTGERFAPYDLNGIDMV